MGAHFLLIFVGLYLSEGVGPVVVGLQLYVPFSALLGALVLGEVLRPQAVFGIGLAVAGVVGMSFDPIVFNHWPVMAAIIVSAFMQALASLLMRGLASTHPLKMQLWTAIVSVPALALLTLAVESGQTAILADPPAGLIGAVLFTALAGSLLGHGGFFFLIKRYPLALSTSITLAVPVVATSLSAVFLDEPLTWRIVTGGLVTILGVALVQTQRAFRSSGS
jgi:O-acetylserine/cysteine efflux transporter